MKPATILSLTVLAPLACTFPVKSGDDPDEATTASTDDEALTTGDPGVCGDGVLDPGEACDDGDPDPDDGCDAQCARTGALAWTYAPDDLEWAIDVAVDAAGRSFLVSDATVIAVDPDGHELWRKAVPDGGAFNSIEVDVFGDLYVAGELGTVHRLTPDADPVWRNDLPDTFSYGVQALALAPDALYSLARDEDIDNRIIVRRHDLATGVTEWTAQTPDGFGAYPHGITVAGAQIVVVGMEHDLPVDENTPPTHPLVATFDTAGALQSFTVGDELGRVWNAAAPVDGGLLFAGYGPEADIVVRRLDDQLAPQWTVYAEGTVGTQALAIASGPGGAIVVAGTDLDVGGSFVRRLDAAGATVWTSMLVEAKPGYRNAPRAVAFGPDFVVALGNAVADGEPSRMWLRRYAID